jgi:hypothetical protein
MLDARAQAGACRPCTDTGEAMTKRLMPVLLVCAGMVNFGFAVMDDNVLLMICGAVIVAFGSRMGQ